MTRTLSRGGVLNSDHIFIVDDGHGGTFPPTPDLKPLVVHDVDSWIPQRNPPAIEKNLLLSPPGSPLIRRERIREDPPNATLPQGNLVHALRKLQMYIERPSFEELTFEGSGITVFVEDCNAQESYEVSEGGWLYGHARDKGVFATAMSRSVVSWGFLLFVSWTLYALGSSFALLATVVIKISAD